MVEVRNKKKGTKCCKTVSLDNDEEKEMLQIILNKNHSSHLFKDIKVKGKNLYEPQTF